MPMQVEEQWKNTTFQPQQHHYLGPPSTREYLLGCVGCALRHHELAMPSIKEINILYQEKKGNYANVGDKYSKACHGNTWVRRDTKPVISS